MIAIIIIKKKFEKKCNHQESGWDCQPLMAHIDQLNRASQQAVLCNACQHRISIELNSLMIFVKHYYYVNENKKEKKRFSILNNLKSLISEKHIK